MANLLFKSGFEGNVSVESVSGHNGTSGWQNITGTDSETGYSWPIDVWNPAVSSMQVLVADPSAVSNTIETTTGTDGGSTKALHTQLLSASGDYPQDPYYMEGMNVDSDLYVKYSVKFDENLLQQMGPNSWQTFFEWKTGGDYRNIVYIYTDENGNPYWHVQGDNNANGGQPFQEFWSADNHDVPVRVGEWFTFETFVHRSGGDDGRIWTAIDGQTIAEHQGSNMGSENLPIDRMMLFQNYGGGDKPVSQWVDNVEIWDGKPSQGEASASAASHAADPASVGSAALASDAAGSTTAASDPTAPASDPVHADTAVSTLQGTDGRDTFIFADPAHENVVTGFSSGADVLDLRGALAGTGYAGTDPLSDGVLHFTQSGADTVVSIDADGAGAGHEQILATLQGVQANALHAGTDYIWH